MDKKQENKTEEGKDYPLYHFNSPRQIYGEGVKGSNTNNLDIQSDNLTCFCLTNREVNRHKLCCFNKLKSKIKFRILWKLEYQIEGVIKSLDNNFVHITTEDKGEVIIHLDEIDCRTIFPFSYDPLKYPIRKNISEDLRRYILKKDNNECQLKLENCTKVATEIDHIIPVSKGGESIAENLQAVCSNCNKEKGTKVLIG